MINRYPHIATIKSVNEIDNGTSTPTIEDDEISIEGRYEPNNGSKTLDYSAKFYCKKKTDFNQFQIDGKSLIFEGVQFKIVQLHNYQTHSEIWLE